MAFGNSNSKVMFLGATRITVGLSAIVEVEAWPYQLGQRIKKISGNTISIVPQPPALSGSSAAGWGNGYLLGDTETFQIDGPATYYLAASGATVVVGVVVDLSAGVTTAL